MSMNDNDREDTWFDLGVKLLLVSSLLGMFAGVTLAHSLVAQAEAQIGVEVVTIGETETFVDGDTTITVEPATMKLFH